MNCRLCGDGTASTIGSVAPTHPGDFETRGFELRECRHCESVYLHPLPTPHDLKTLYVDSVQFSDPHYTDPAQIEKILDYYGTTVRNRQLLPAAGGKVLEVGAGFAWVARACKALRSEVVTVAQDVSGECAQRCAWADQYFVGPIESLPHRGPYELISLTHVIEHVPDPRATLASLVPMLAPDGRFLVTAPFRPTGWSTGGGIEPWRRYSYLHVPAHISYLSRTWFENAMPAIGLEVSSWDATHEEGQAFELVLRRARSRLSF